MEDLEGIYALSQHGMKCAFGHAICVGLISFVTPDKVA